MAAGDHPAGFGFSNNIQIVFCRNRTVVNLYKVYIQLLQGV